MRGKVIYWCVSKYIYVYMYRSVYLYVYMWLSRWFVGAYLNIFGYTYTKMCTNTHICACRHEMCTNTHICACRHDIGLWMDSCWCVSKSIYMCLYIQRCVLVHTYVPVEIISACSWIVVGAYLNIYMSMRTNICTCTHICGCPGDLLVHI